MISVTNYYITVGTHVVFLVLNIVEGVGVILMFKPFLGEKKEKPMEQLQWNQ